MEKNKQYEIKIEDLGNNGEGIGRIDGYTVFVEGALPEETVRVLMVKIKKHYGYGKLMEILVPSKDRVEPYCPVAAQCGGCQLQHLSYEGQLAFKTKKVKDHLERIGGLQGITVQGALGMENPWRYRNKAQFPVGGTVDMPKVGFYAKRSHRIIDTPVCFLQHEINDEIVRIVREFLVEFHIPPYEETTHRGLVRHILTRIGKQTGEIMVCLVLNGKKLPRAEILVKRLCAISGMTSIVINENRDKTNVILGEKIYVLWGKSFIHDKIGEVSFEISPLSFYQVNPTQTNVLYQTALNMAELDGTETVLDLYCGIGTISLFFAQKAKSVFGVEIVPQAIEDARRNAEKNGIHHADFMVGAAEDVIPALYEKQGIFADVVVVDPPRKGCDEKLLETMLSIAPKKIVYVSCDSATLARDLAYLCTKGYQVQKVQVVDMFPWTVHVETVVLLSHKKPDSHINVKVEFGEGEGKVPLDNITKRAEVYKPKERVTYKMIKEYIEAKYGFKVHTTYIAEVKRDLGLPMYDAPNAVEELKHPRKHPTEEKVEAIKDALRYYEEI